jgi:iron complex outermembrane receptor protein
MLHVNLLVMAAGLATCIAAPAAAQSASGEVVSEVDEIIVTGERLTGDVIGEGTGFGVLGERDIADTPFSVTSFRDTLIDNTIALNLSEILTRDPSVRATVNSAGFTDDFNIRGFAVNRSAFLYDGIPGLIQTDGIRGVSNLSQIEIFRGVNTFTGGTPGVGGTLNFVPKRPGSADVNQITFGYVTDQPFAEADFSRRFGSGEQFGARFNASYADGDGAVDGFSRRTESYALYLDWRPTDTLTFAVEGTRFRSRSNHYRDNIFLNPGVSVPQPPDPETNYSQPWAFIEISGARIFTKATWDFAPGWSFSAGGGKLFGDEENGYYSAFGRIADEQGTLIQAPFRSFQPLRDVAGAQARLNGQFTTGEIEHRLSFNYTYSENAFRGGGGGAPPITSNLYRPVIAPEPPVVFTGITSDTKTKIDGFGGFYEASFLDGRIIGLVGAQNVTIRSLRFGETIYDDSKLAPFGALTFKPVENVSLYASYTEGLEQGATAPPTAVNAFELFAPRASVQYEAGAKVSLGELLLTTAVFEITRPLEFLNQQNVFVSDGEQTHRGFEVQASGSIGQQIRITGGVTYLDASIDNGDEAVRGNRPVGVPEWSAAFYGEYDTPFLPGITINGGLNYQSSAFVDLQNFANRRTDGFVTVDLGARYAFSVADTDWSLRFLVNNVFEEVYWVNTGGLSLSAPRTFRVSLSAGF